MMKTSYIETVFTGSDSVVLLRTTEPGPGQFEFTATDKAGCKYPINVGIAVSQQFANIDAAHAHVVSVALATIATRRYRTTAVRYDDGKNGGCGG